MGQDQQGDHRRRRAARGQARYDAPIDRTADPMHRRADSLGGGGVEQVGADRRAGMDPEQQHQQRGHQRTAADARQPHQHADKETGQRIEGVDRGQEMHVGATQLVLIRPDPRRAGPDQVGETILPGLRGQS